MNNKLFASLLCITVLSFAPACKREKKATPKKDVKKMIEIDATVFELEKDTEDEKSSVAKF